MAAKTTTPKAAKKATKRKATGKPAAKRPPGRPSLKTPELIEEICARLSKGEPLAVICRDKGMPDPSTVWDWQQKDPVVSQAIARAREAGEDAIAADCLLIADDASGDYRMGERSVLVDQDHIQRSRLRIETRLKLLAKWNPKRWGEKVDLNHGGQKENPIQLLLGQLGNKSALPVAPTPPDDEEK